MKSRSYLNELNSLQFEQQSIFPTLTPKIRLSEGVEESGIIELILLFVFTYMQRLQLRCVRRLLQAHVKPSTSLAWEALRGNRFDGARVCVERWQSRRAEA